MNPNHQSNHWNYITTVLHCMQYATTICRSFFLDPPCTESNRAGPRMQASCLPRRMPDMCLTGLLYCTVLYSAVNDTARQNPKLHRMACSQQLDRSPPPPPPLAAAEDTVGLCLFAVLFSVRLFRYFGSRCDPVNEPSVVPAEIAP